MFEPVRMNHFRSAQRQMPYNGNPFPFQNSQKPPLNRSPMSLSGFLSGNTQQYSMLNKGIGGFANILNNVQQVLRVVETTAPIIKEYGPMIKNLPTMYRMVKAFRNMDGLGDEEDGESIDSTANTESAENNEGTQDDILEQQQSDLTEPKLKKAKDGRSTPKLYI